MPSIEKDVEKAGSASKAAVDEVSSRAGKLADAASEELDEAGSGLEDRIADIREELMAIAEHLERFAANRLDEVEELVAEAGHQSARAVRAVGREARSVGAAVRRDPLPVVVGLGVIALLTALFVGRSERR